MQIEQLLYWSGMTGTEHTTSSLNEEEEKLFESFSDCSDWLGKSHFCFDHVNRLNMCFSF